MSRLFVRFVSFSSLALVLGLSSRAALAQSVPSIDAFVGSGSRTAYFVLDFGVSSHTFGYRYDGASVTAGDMIVAVDTALPSLVASLAGNRDSGFGRFVNGFGYGSNSLSNFTANFSTTPYTGWNYYVSSSPLTTVAPAWTASDWGIDGRDSSSATGAFQNLSTHAWHGFSWGRFDENTFAFLGSAPRVNAAAVAPEPSSACLLGLAAIGLGARGARKRRVAGN